MSFPRNLAVSSTYWATVCSLFFTNFCMQQANFFYFFLEFFLPRFLSTIPVFLLHSTLVVSWFSFVFDVFRIYLGFIHKQRIHRCYLHSYVSAQSTYSSALASVFNPTTTPIYHFHVDSLHITAFRSISMESANVHVFFQFAQILPWRTSCTVSHPKSMQGNFRFFHLSIPEFPCQSIQRSPQISWSWPHKIRFRIYFND